jgi:DNA (cytosine-5)-methyltransferase 1
MVSSDFYSGKCDWRVTTTCSIATITRLTQGADFDSVCKGFEGRVMGGSIDIGVQRRAKRSEAREIWSFFSGAMGLDLGLESAGLAPTLAVEIDPTFCRTIRANRPQLDLIEGDVAKLTGAALRERRGFDGEVFLMAGGQPCQPFSSGGKRAALSDPRGNLIYEYFRLIADVRPRYFVLENVANLTTAALRHRPIAERPGKHGV